MNRQDLYKSVSTRLPRKYREDERGVAAVEFAIIAPIIIAIYLGLAELSMILDVKRQVSHSASVAADLATQTSQLNDTDSADMISAVLRVADVPETANYTVHMESFDRDSSGNVVSLGEVVFNTGGESNLPSVDVASLSTDVLDEDSGLVVARVSYEYTPMGLTSTMTGREDKFLSGTFNLTETFLLKPRQSSTIPVGSSAGTIISCTGSADNVSCSSGS